MVKQSFRDPVTHVLKAWGYVTSNAAGDIAQAEDDSFTLTPGAWEWNGSSWITYTPPAEPNEKGFEGGLFAAFNFDILAVTTLAQSYPTMIQLIRDQSWPFVEAIILDAHTNSKVTAGQYAAIQAAATANHIPVTLP